MSEMGQDRPIFAPARSRSQGPLSDQVADAPNPRGQCRSWGPSLGACSGTINSMEVHVRSRREAVAAVRSSGGPLTDLTPAAHPLGREPLKMPLFGR